MIEKTSPILNSLYTPLDSPVPGGQNPQKGRTNQLTEQEGNSSSLSSSPFGEVGRGFSKPQSRVSILASY